MQITITVDANGLTNLNCSEDRPWTVIRALKAVIDALEQQQAQREAQEAAQKPRAASPAELQAILARRNGS